MMGGPHAVVDVGPTRTLPTRWRPQLSPDDTLTATADPSTDPARRDQLVDDAIRHVWRHGVAAQSTRAAHGPIAVRASGVHVEDIDGKVYLDALSGGSAAATLGHGRADIADAIAEQARTLQWVSLRTFLNEPSIALAKRLAEIS